MEQNSNAWSFEFGNAYRVENPGGTVPSWGIEYRPQVEEEHCCDTTATQGVTFVIFGLGDLDVRADNPQTNGTTCCTNQQQVTATNVINQPKQPNESHHSLHYTEDSGGEQTSVCTLNTNLEALLASVIDDHIHGWDGNKMRHTDLKTVGL